MKIQELRQLPPKKLIEMLKKTQRELAIGKFHVKTGQNQNTAQIKKMKKIIARILTLLNAQKEQ
jgi:ribosomal protein L29